MVILTKQEPFVNQPNTELQRNTEILRRRQAESKKTKAPQSMSNLVPLYVSKIADKVEKDTSSQKPRVEAVELPQDTPQTKPEPKKDPHPTPHFIKVHSKLAAAVLSLKSSNLDRAFVLWAIIRSDGKSYHYQNDVIAIAAKTGKTERTIKKWIAAGENIFWVKGWLHGRRTISHKSPNRVLDYFGLPEPGKVIDVNIKKLLGKLKVVRAELFATWISRDSRWAARGTIEIITGVKPRSQINYERTNHTQKQKVFANWGWFDDTGKHQQMRQLPNRYLAPLNPHFQKHNSKRYDLRTVDFNSQNSDVLDIAAVKVGVTGRVLFDAVSGAIDKAKKLKKLDIEGCLFGVIGYGPKKSILCKTVEIQLA